MSKPLFSNLIGWLIVFIGTVLLDACSSTRHFRDIYTEQNALLHATDTLLANPFLKAHMNNGDVCILTEAWEIDTAAQVLSGFGTVYDFKRAVIDTGQLSFPIDQVDLFETNKEIGNIEGSRIAALSTMFTINTFLGVICTTIPKACWGSCPTFYLDPDNTVGLADAESFSNAILPSMEYTDIDALGQVKTEDGKLSLTMKNEALETHVVRSVNLLAFPTAKEECVYHSTANEFFLCTNPVPPNSVTAEEGDITNLLSYSDQIERFSLADSSNLNSKESIIIQFDGISTMDQPGLVIGFRQTLMTTYFIYNAMGYMGDEVSDILARLEQDPEVRGRLNNGLVKQLGTIDISVWDDEHSKWVAQGSHYETGPIAINTQLMPLDVAPNLSTLIVKIDLNKGLWRLDHIGLTNIIEQVEPIILQPTIAFNKGTIDKTALDQINAPEQHLITLPGNAYRFDFELPEANKDYSCFLSARGYYMGWMRSEWIADKDIRKLRQLLVRPKKFLKAETKEYKLYESIMEELFWNSRIDTRNFTYYDK